MSNEFVQVLTTTPTRADAERIALILIEKKLAACVQILGPMTSLYRWKGALERAEEFLCLIKSRAAVFGELEKAIRENHPYEVPEILAAPVVAGSEPYLRWLDGEIG